MPPKDTRSQTLRTSISDISIVSHSVEYPDNIEKYIGQLLQADEIQARIRFLLQSAIRDELSRLSIVLKDAIREWIAREKEKFELEKGKRLPEGKGANNENQKISELQLEVDKLKRQLELKNHENQIVTSALKKMMDSKTNPRS